MKKEAILLGVALLGSNLLFASRTGGMEKKERDNSKIVSFYENENTETLEITITLKEKHLNNVFDLSFLIDRMALAKKESRFKRVHVSLKFECPPYSQEFLENIVELVEASTVGIDFADYGFAVGFDKDQLDRGDGKVVLEVFADFGKLRKRSDRKKISMAVKYYFDWFCRRYNLNKNNCFVHLKINKFENKCYPKDLDTYIKEVGIKKEKIMGMGWQGGSNKFAKKALWYFPSHIEIFEFTECDIEEDFFDLIIFGKKNLFYRLKFPNLNDFRLIRCDKITRVGLFNYVNPGNIKRLHFEDCSSLGCSATSFSFSRFKKLRSFYASAPDEDLIGSRGSDRLKYLSNHLKELGIKTTILLGETKAENIQSDF